MEYMLHMLYKCNHDKDNSIWTNCVPSDNATSAVILIQFVNLFTPLNDVSILVDRTFEIFVTFTVRFFRLGMEIDT